MVTLKEIARECNVSAATVSNILNGKHKVSQETRQKVMDVVRMRGYQPNSLAKGLRTQKTKTIGIIAEDIAQFSTPDILEGIMNYFEPHGYRTVVKNLRMYARWNDTWYDDDQAYHSILDPILQEIASLMVDGLIYIAGHARMVPCFLDNMSMPAVMAYAYACDSGVPSVLVDDEASAYEIVKYLIGRGHRRIGVIAGNAENIHSQKRLIGYQKALYEAGILYNPKWVYYAQWDKESAYEAAKELLQTEITAVFCMADRMAGGVYCLLDEQGRRAGRDIAVAGFDNQDIAEYFVPGLTTMALPLHDIGSTAARCLLEQIEKPEAREKETPQEILIPCTFTERDSVQRI